MELDENLLRFMFLCGDLKKVKRKGWVERGIPNVESVADHSHRMAIFALLLGTKTKANRNRCIMMALVHDLAECLVGDITPSDGVSKEEKHSREKSAMRHITDMLCKEMRDEIMDLWEEYESGVSLEAQLVKDIDKFEMIAQAYQYERESGVRGKLQDFFDSTEDKFRTDSIRKWSTSLRNIRDKND